MTRIDQFASRFRAAAKEVHRYAALRYETVLLLTDLSAEAAERFGSSIQRAVELLPGLAGARWNVVSGEHCDSVGELLALVTDEQPDMVVTYRNLHSGAWRWPHSLSDHVEVLTQVTRSAVLLLPRPGEDGKTAVAAPSTVMALTNHLSGDSDLVNAAAACTEQDGRLLLAHVEDDAVLERYLAATDRIAEIPSELVRRRLPEQLLKEPRDYAESCAEALQEARPGLRVEPIITRGHQLVTFRRLVQEHEVDLLVLNTKDDEQQAMHGTAYSLAVELRDVGLLLL